MPAWYRCCAAHPRHARRAPCRLCLPIKAPGQWLKAQREQWHHCWRACSCRQHSAACKQCCPALPSFGTATDGLRTSPSFLWHVWGLCYLGRWAHAPAPRLAACSLARSNTPPCGLQPCHNACVASLLCLPPFHLPAASAISAAGLAAQVGGWQLSSAATASHHGLAMACRGKTTAAGQALQSCLTTFWAVA